MTGFLQVQHSRNPNAAAPVQALVRDVLRATQVQMHVYEPHELLDLAEAAGQLARPSQLWMQVGGFHGILREVLVVHELQGCSILFLPNNTLVPHSLRCSLPVWHSWLFIL
jgi:hypothetical protein